MDKFEVISFYFNLGMKYSDILMSLAARHGVILSKRHLIWLLKMHGLKCKQDAGLLEIIHVIMDQLEGPGRLNGFRWMYNNCLKNGVHAKKEDVCLILAALDPNSSAMHRSRRLIRKQYFALGPNYIWHADSCHKLKLYGICTVVA